MTQKAWTLSLSSGNDDAQSPDVVASSDNDDAQKPRRCHFQPQPRRSKAPTLSLPATTMTLKVTSSKEKASRVALSAAVLPFQARTISPDAMTFHLKGPEYL